MYIYIILSLSSQGTILRSCGKVNNNDTYFDVEGFFMQKKVMKYTALLIIGLSLNIVSSIFTMDLHVLPTMVEEGVTISLKIQCKKLKTVVKEKTNKESVVKKRIKKQPVKSKNKKLIRQQESIAGPKPLALKQKDIKDERLHSLSLELDELIASREQSIKYNKCVTSCSFARTYTLLQKNPDLQHDWLLGWKLMAVMFKEINSVQEFCDKFIAFPSGTGVMAKTFAVFGHNEEFVNDYDKITGSINQKTFFLPIIVCLVKNRAYN